MVLGTASTSSTSSSMFVHSGAGLHGHEFSSRSRSQSSSQTQGQQPSQPPTRPLPLLRSALRPRAYTESNNNNKNNNINRNSYSPHVPSARPSAKNRSISNPVLPADLPRRPVSEIAISKKDLAVRFQEPTMASIAPSISTLPSDDEESVAGSDVSDHTDASSTLKRKRKKRLMRKTTRFALAHPAPQLRTKQRKLIQFRPRLLLQLQEVAGNRPNPTFDVLPSSTIAGSVIIPKLTKKFPRIFNAKPDLGPDDLLFVRSEDYQAEDHEHQEIDDRELMAVVSPVAAELGNNADIIMGDGSVWTTAHMPNGSFEFTRLDSHGSNVTARWVRKPVKGDVSPSITPPSDNRWTFSVIDPATRRHPIMGVLTTRELVVYDTYSTMSASSGRFPPTRPFSADLSGDRMSGYSPTKEERSSEIVPEEYRQLMAVTASWINLRLENWPAAFRPKMGRPSAQCRSASTSSHSERRRTFPSGDPKSQQQMLQMSPRNSIKGPTPAFEAAFPKRSKSTTAAFTEKRRLNSDSLEEDEDGEKVRETFAASTKTKANKSIPSIPSDGEEKTHTCRFKVRRWTQKFFSRKSCKT